MKIQFILKTLAVISGFLTIALLSSIAAFVQAEVFPSSIHIFENPELVENAYFILITKLITVLLCCVAGGFVSEKISDWRESNPVDIGIHGDCHCLYLVFHRTAFLVLVDFDGGD